MKTFLWIMFTVFSFGVLLPVSVWALFFAASDNERVQRQRRGSGS